MCDKTLRESFFDKLRFTKRKEGTIKQYEKALDLLNAFLVKNYSLTLDKREDVKAIDGIMLDAYQEHVRSLNVSESTEHLRAAAAKTFFAFLYRASITDRNLSDAISMIHVTPKEQLHFSWTEAEEMMRKYDSKYIERDVCILGIALTMGLRISAIRGINIGDICKGDPSVLSYVNKGGKVCHKYVPEFIMQAIDRYVIKYRLEATSGEPLFLSQQNTRVSENTVRRVCDRAAGYVGKHGTAHAMRRTCLSRTDELQGIEMAKIMGEHTNTSTTERYLYDSPERMERIYKNMDLFSFENDDKNI